MTKEIKEPKALEPWQIDDAARLKALFASRATPQLSQLEFGAKYAIGSQGMVWQYLNARRPLNIAAATAFAIGLGVKIDAFSPTIASQIGDASQSSSNGSAGVTYIERVNREEMMLLEAYRLTGEDGRRMLATAAGAVARLDLPAAVRNKG